MAANKEHKMKKQGFTLVEIMIVVLIIGLLAAIAIPNFIKARKTTQMNACIDNLRSIEGAMEQAQMAGTPAASIDADVIYGPDAYIKTKPVCPATKAEYTIPTDGSRPVCPNPTVGGDGYTHVLPGGATGVEDDG